MQRGTRSESGSHRRGDDDVVCAIMVLIRAHLRFMRHFKLKYKRWIIAIFSKYCDRSGITMVIFW